jgi:hypothetical protein
MSAPEPPYRPPDPATEPVRPVQPRRPHAPVEEPVYAYPPEVPPRGPWWEDPWPALLTGLVALLIGGVIGYLIGDSHESERQRPGATSTVTSTATVERPKTVVQTHTVTASTVREAPPNPANEERRKEAETELRKTEKENRELRKLLEESGRSP